MQRLTGFAWMALASTSFSFMSIFARMASPSLGWAQLACVRCLVSIFVSYGFAKARGTSLVVHDRRRSWARSLFGTGSVICTFYVLSAPEISVGDVATLGATSPIFIALLAPFLLGERSSRRVWIAGAIAFSGVAIVTEPTLHIAGLLAIITLVGALFSALAMIWLRRLGPSESPEAVVFHFALVSTATCLIFSLTDLRMPDAGSTVYLIATGLAGGIAQLALTRAYAREQAARLGVFGYIGVVITQVLAVLMLDEQLGPHQMLGAALVIAGGLFLAVASILDQRRS